MQTPRVLYWDIETSLQLASVFQLAHNDWIDPSALVTERYVICASWQWEGEDNVHSVSVLDNPKLFTKDPSNDRFVLEKLHEVLSQCDVLVHHNGDSFDLRYVKTRMLVQGLDPLPPITTIDTYKVAKSAFMFNSNKLNYIGKLLGLGEKISTTPGLWADCLRGDRRAIREMVEYNKGDVTLLRKVFKKLAPYVPNHINRELFGLEGCPRCGSTKVQSRGIHRAISRIYRRFQCQKCRGWFRAVENDKKVKPTKRVL